MDKWEEHVKLEITDAVDDPFRLLQITVSLNDLKDIDLIPEGTHDNLTNLITTVNNGSNQ